MICNENRWALLAACELQSLMLPNQSLNDYLLLLHLQCYHKWNSIQEQLTRKTMQQSYHN